MKALYFSIITMACLPPCVSASGHEDQDLGVGLGHQACPAEQDRTPKTTTYHGKTQQSTVQVEGAHTLGVMGVSWAPAVPRGSLTSGKAPGPPARRFATGGCDNTVKVGSWSHWPGNTAGAMLLLSTRPNSKQGTIVPGFASAFDRRVPSLCWSQLPVRDWPEDAVTSPEAGARQKQAPLSVLEGCLRPSLLPEDAKPGLQVWFYNEGQRRWEQEPAALAGHTGWVRDVAWAPNLGLNANTIASASQVRSAKAAGNSWRETG